MGCSHHCMAFIRLFCVEILPKKKMNFTTGNQPNHYLITQKCLLTTSHWWTGWKSTKKKSADYQITFEKKNQFLAFCFVLRKTKSLFCKRRFRCKIEFFFSNSNYKRNYALVQNRKFIFRGSVKLLLHQ